MKRMKERCWLSEVDVEIEDRDGDLKVMPWYQVVLIAGGLFVVFTFEIRWPSTFVRISRRTGHSEIGGGRDARSGSHASASGFIKRLFHKNSSV